MQKGANPKQSVPDKVAQEIVVRDSQCMMWHQTRCTVLNIVNMCIKSSPSHINPVTTYIKTYVCGEIKGLFQLVKACRPPITNTDIMYMAWLRDCLPSE